MTYTGNSNFSSLSSVGYLAPPPGAVSDRERFHPFSSHGNNGMYTNEISEPRKGSNHSGIPLHPGKLNMLYLNDID